MSIDKAIERLEEWADYEEDALRRAPTFAQEEAHRCRAENYSEVVRLIYDDPKLYAADKLIGLLKDIKHAHEDENENPEYLPSLIAEIPDIIAEALGK